MNFHPGQVWLVVESRRDSVLQQTGWAPPEDRAGVGARELGKH